MTRVWNNGNHNQQENGHVKNDPETKFNLKETHLNGNNYHKSEHTNGNVEEHYENDNNSETKKKSFFSLCCSENLEKDLAEQSKVMLNMIYFFQILPFYILQFTSGMALGKILILTQKQFISIKQ